MKMQDLRERLLRHQPQPDSEAKYAISQIWPTADSAVKPREDGFPAVRAQDPNAKTGLTADSGKTNVAPAAQPPAHIEARSAVTALFRFADGFDARIRDLIKALEPLETLSRSAVKEVAPLADFRDQIAQLAGTLEPMKAFYEQLVRLARDFPPMQSLYEQVSRIPEEFQTQLLHLAELLTPAKAFRRRIEELAKAFDPVDVLEAQFLEMAESFGKVLGEGAQLKNGNAGGIGLGRPGAPESAASMEMATGRAGSDKKSTWVLD